MHRPVRAVLAAVIAALVAHALTNRPATAQQTPSPLNASAFAEADLRGWLTYLASDELQGRQTYTEGIGLAGAYIARNLEAWGVAPAGDNGSYFQTVRVLGLRTRSNSSVTVTVKGQSRTFKDGEGVTFPRNQGGKQTVSARAEFVGHGISYAPLGHNDYARANAAGKVVLFTGNKGPTGFTTTHNRLLNARARNAIDNFGAVATIGPLDTAVGAGGGNAARVPEDRRVDFQTAQRVDAPVAPQLTAGDEFFNFVLSGTGHSYPELKSKAERQDALPSIDLRDVTIAINVDAEYDVVQTRFTRNVAGMVRGGDTALADQYVMLGAHYDHIGYLQFASTTKPGAPDTLIASCAGQVRPMPREGDNINNGADDDGSGTVGLMAIARAFAQGPRPRRSVLFVWHTAEEGGLNGSRYMADHPVVALDRVAAQLNIDMIGRNRCDDAAESNTVHVVGADRISTELHNANEDANASLPRPLALNYELNDRADLESLYTRSDHYSYAAKGVPVIFFTTGLHRDYHYVTDEVDKILFDKLGRVAQLVYTTGWRLANADRAPVRDRLGPRVGKGQTGRIAAAAPAPNPIPASVPLAADAPFTVAVNTSTIEGAPVYVADNGPQGSGFQVINGGVRNLANGGAHAATNAETQLLVVGTPNVRLLFTVAEGLYRVVAKRSAGIRTPGDLRGKRVSIPPNTSAHYYLVRTLAAAGLTEADVTFVDLPRDQMAAGVAAGRADAMVMWEPEAEKAVAALGQDAVVFQDNKMYREFFSLYASTEVLGDPKRRQQLVGFVRALLAATDEVKRRPEPHFALVARTVRQSVDWVSRSWKHHAFPAALPSQLLDVMVEEERWVARNQKREPRPRATLQGLIDTSILAEARAAR
jgi:ABC-type nitrate/sulfonate/bicarbonate transport system substrate-binding protein